MIVANFSEFRKDLKKYLDDVEENHETLIIKRSNGKGTVMISLEEFNSITETNYLTSSKKNVEYLLKSIEEAKAGKFKEVSIEELESFE